MPKQSLILYACGSRLISDFLELCRKNDIEIKSVINNMPGAVDCEIPSVAAATYDFAREQTPFLVPLFTPRNRYLASREALERQLLPFGLLSDRRNDLPDDLIHGAGCFINKAVVIGAASRLGDFVLINRGACLGHHQAMGDFASIGPGVVTGGDVTIGTGAMVATGAVILPDVTIGEHAIVGAGSVVTKDVEPYSVVMGNPARHARENKNAF
jgi:acetyltransferase-like isoleucine patch superfamily enzyme